MKKRLLSAVAALLLVVAVILFAGSESAQHQPASSRGYIVSSLAGADSSPAGGITLTNGTYVTAYRHTGPTVDGPSPTARFQILKGIALGPDRSLYVTDSPDNKISKITTDGMVSTIAGQGLGGHDDGDCARATFSLPTGIAVDKVGNVYVAETGAIRKITIDTTGCRVSTLPGGFHYPDRLAINTAGNLYVADNGCAVGKESSIRKVTPDGVVITIASSGMCVEIEGAPSPATPNLSSGIAVDAAGNVYVSGFHDIRKITPDGRVSKFAGTGKDGKTDGVGARAAFSMPLGLVVDADGNLYVADHDAHAVRKISPAGEVTTIVGAGNYEEMQKAWRDAGQLTPYRDGPADKAMLASPNDVVVDTNGVYVADWEKVRKITPAR